MSEQACRSTHDHDAAGCLDCECNIAPWSPGYDIHERALGRESAVIAVLDEMRDHGTGATLYYAQKLAAALGEPDVITPEVVASGRLSR